MTDSRCTQPHVRQQIDEMLAEPPRIWLSLGGVDEGLTHLKTCAACLSELPFAGMRLQSIRTELTEEAFEGVSRLRHEYLAFKHQQAALRERADFMREDDKLRSCKVLAKLVTIGDEITCNVLCDMRSEYEGVPWEHFMPVISLAEHEEVRISRFGYYGFISEMAPEDQSFVAAAAMACAVLMAPRLMGEEDDADLIRWLSTSPLSAEALLVYIEESAGYHLARYLETANKYREGQKNATGAEAAVRVTIDSDLRNLIAQLRSELLADFADFSDSMKATQMELLRATEGSRGIDPEPALRKALGATYEHLDQRSQDHLKTAESAYNAKSLADSGSWQLS